MNTSNFSIRDQSCPNIDCEFYGQSDSGNIAVHSRKQGRFRCNICNKTWSAYSDEATFGLRSDEEIIERAFTMFEQDIPIRTIAKRLKVSPSTVQRWKTRFIKSKFNNFNF